MADKLRQLIVFLANYRPRDEMSYIRQLLPAIKLTADELEGVNIKFMYVAPESVNQEYAFGFVHEAGYSPIDCTLTRISDDDGGVGQVLKIHAPRIDEKRGAGEASATSRKAYWKAHDEPVLQLAYLSMGTRLVTGSRNGVIRVWDESSVSPTETINCGFGPVVHLRVASNGDALIAAGHNTKLHSWRLGDRQTPTQIAPSHRGSGLDVNPANSNEIAVAYGRGFYVWDLARRSMCAKISRIGGMFEYCVSAIYSSDGAHLITTSSRVMPPSSKRRATLWSTRNLSRLGDFDLGRYRSDFPASATRRPNSDDVVILGSEGTLLCSIRSRKVIANINAPVHYARSAAVSPDGAHLFTVGNAAGACLWDIQSGLKISEYEHLSEHEHLKGDRFPTTVIYHPEGQSVTVGFSNGWIAHQVV